MNAALTAKAHVLSAVRTPIGRFLGTLSDRSGVELGVHAVRSALASAQVDATSIDLLVFGMARGAGAGPNPARQVCIKAGLPQTTPAYTVNMACASGAQAILEGVHALQSGRARRVVVGGMESMSNVPYLLPRARTGYRMGHAPLVDAMYQDGFHCPLADQLMGATAETLAREYAISRRAQDEFALESQRRAVLAWQERRFDAELAPVPAEDRRKGLDRDEHMRPESSLSSLAKLPAVFAEAGTVTAGNSSGLTDAAAALVLEAPAAGQAALAELLDWELAGVDPARMGLGPVPATQRLLARAGLTLPQIGLIELNEAFAAQVLACARDLTLDLTRTNVWGGAIALGHPIGATGARIAVTLLHAMRSLDRELGISTLCVSGGMGASLLWRRGKR